MSELRPPQQSIMPGIRPVVPAVPAGPPKIAPIPNQAVKAHDPNTDPISLVDEGKAGGAAAPPSKIKAISGSGGMHTHAAYKRPPDVTGHGAVRVRSFHGRLSEEGMAFLDDKVNEWLDSHPEIEIKFATTTIGQFEGKIRELALIITVWY